MTVRTLRGTGLAALTIVAGSLGACGVSKPVACTAESAQEPVIAIVKEQLEKSVSDRVKRDDGSKAAGLSKIRAAIGQLVFAIEDIRTSKTDPNSTKRFCTGVLRIKFPSDALSDADKARQDASMNSVSDLADASDVERHADSFTSNIDFNVQPTDDGRKVFAETESGSNMIGFAGEVIASELLRASVEDAKRQQQISVDQQNAAQSAALTEQRNANVASARTDDQLAVQTIGATWQALPPPVRSRLLPLQRAWIRKKDADCAVEAAGASIEPAEKEVARLKCDTRVTQDRIGWLGQYRDEGSAVSNPGSPDIPGATPQGGNPL
jgi:uncharacterized protein YecT (DUF1311 family)